MRHVIFTKSTHDLSIGSPKGTPHSVQSPTRVLEAKNTIIKSKTKESVSEVSNDVQIGSKLLCS